MEVFPIRVRQLRRRYVDLRGHISNRMGAILSLAYGLLWKEKGTDEPAAKRKMKRAGMAILPKQTPLEVFKEQFKCKCHVFVTL
jgi:AmiR/NasT family two-component response regulator